MRFSTTIKLSIIIILCSVLGIILFPHCKLLNAFYKADKIVVLNLRSPVGLGNQLFTYASALSLSKRLKAELWIIPPKNLTKDFSSVSRSFALDLFDIKVDQFMTLKQYQRLTKIIHHTSLVVRENNFFEVKNDQAKVYLLDGCFESEKFFEAYTQEIKELFDFSNQSIHFSKKYDQILDKIQNTQSVAVHIRLKDFTLESWRMLPITYQIEGIRFVKQHLQTPHFFIFSDDPTVAKVLFYNLENITIVSDESTSSIEDFSLMMQCKHIITANSTYSWWAAFLNKNPNKIVIAPYPRYFNKFLTEYTYPSDWKKINPFTLNQED